MIMGSTQQIETVATSMTVSASKLVSSTIGTSIVQDSTHFQMSMHFRILKTLLLVAAWISFGMNFEVIGSTFEDLKLYLNVDYHSVSFNLVLRNTGYLVMVSFSGYLFDRFPHFANLFMCFSSLLIAVPNLFIPITKAYWLSSTHFFIQGISSAFYDLGGNQMILSLWNGISHSPINLMHAGYGVGAILVVQIAKPFIKFNPMNKYRVFQSNNGNQSSDMANIMYSSKNIDIRVPYWISGIIAIAVSALFLMTQFSEFGFFKKKTVFAEHHSKQLIQNEKNNSRKETRPHFLKRLVFGKKDYQGHSLIYMSIQIILITVVLFCLQGYLTILSKFLLTYLTKGPARFGIDEYTNIQSLFWLLFIFSRVCTTFAAFRLNNCHSSFCFMFVLLAFNAVLASLLLVPLLATSKLFFWLTISFISLVVAPTHPSMFMIAKHILDDYNSFIIALFSIGLGLSSVAFQELLGDLLDRVPSRDYYLGFSNFNSSYVIGHVLFVPAILSFILFSTLIIIHRYYSHLIKK